MAPRHMSYNPGGRKPIRGKVISAAIEVKREIFTLYSPNLTEPDQWPFQVNDMGGWLPAIYAALTPEDRKLLASYEHTLRFQVNGEPVGKGAKKGHGSNINIFTYFFTTDANNWRIDLKLASHLHQATYARKVKEGKHIPTPRSKEPTNPYFEPRKLPWLDPARNQYIYPTIPSSDHTTWTWSCFPKEEVQTVINYYAEDFPNAPPLTIAAIPAIPGKAPTAAEGFTDSGSFIQPLKQSK